MLFSGFPWIRLIALFYKKLFVLFPVTHRHECSDSVAGVRITVALYGRASGRVMFEPKDAERLKGGSKAVCIRAYGGN